MTLTATRVSPTAIRVDWADLETVSNSVSLLLTGDLWTNRQWQVQVTTPSGTFTDTDFPTDQSFDYRDNYGNVTQTFYPLATLTLYPDPDRSRVQVFVVPGQGDTVTVYRVDEHGARVPVRGGVGVSRDVILDDYECPLDVEVDYVVAADTDPTGTLASASTTLSGSAGPCLVHPTDPTRNVFVTLVDDTPVEATSRGTVHHVIGSSLPVVTHGPRNDVRRELRLWVPYSGAPAVWQATDDGSPLLVKVPAGCAAVPGWRWVERITAVKRGQDPTGHRGFDLTLDSFDVDTPAGYITADPVNSWAAVKTYAGTWQNVKDTYATWADVRLERFPP